MRRGKRHIAKGSFAAVIKAYKASDKFMSLGASTRDHYGRMLDLAERPEILGAFSTDEIRPALVQSFLDGLSHLPANQKLAQTALKAVENWALVRDLIPYPITTGTQAPGSKGGHVPWTDEQVKLAETCSRPHIARIITLAANTGQRGSDVVKMRWSDIEEFDGRPGINVVQRKTGLKIWIPMTRELMAVIPTWERRPGFIALKEDGRPWTRTQLSDQWTKERDTSPALASIATAGLVLHGLRATAVVRLRRAGATTGQIADMVGMSEVMVNHYCRFSNQRANALAAVHYLDRSDNPLKNKVATFSKSRTDVAKSRS